MKKLLVLLCPAVLVFGMLGVAHATLFDRGGGLIYDDVLDITWLQDVNYAKTSGYDSDGFMSWDAAMAWAAQLDYQGYTDWRLPTTVDGPWIWGYSGPDSGDSYATYTYSYTYGYNLYNSEMGYMFYKNLGNLGYRATDGTYPQPGWGLNNTDEFTNWLNDAYYWSGTESGSYPDTAWTFIFFWGSQARAVKNPDSPDDKYAWAVRDGDVSASVPDACIMLLLGTSLIGLVGFGRKCKKNKIPTIHKEVEGRVIWLCLSFFAGCVICYLESESSLHGL